jgi:hypothetical protein
MISQWLLRWPVFSTRYSVFCACYSKFLYATVFSACSLVRFLSGAQRDVCSGLLSGAQHNVLVSSMSCSRSSGRVKIFVRD